MRYLIQSLRGTAALALLAFVVVSFGAPACTLGRGPTAVAQGHRYSTGSPRYDAFFTAVYELQLTLASAPREEQLSRERLARRLGLPTAAPREEISEKLKTTMADLSQKGLIVRLELSGITEEDGQEPSAVLKGTGREQSRSEERLLEGIERSAETAAQLFVAMRKVETEVDHLREERRDLLTEVDATFAGSPTGKRKEVLKNLDDAERVLELALVRSDQVAEASDALLALLEKAIRVDHPKAQAEASETGGGSSQQDPGKPPVKHAAPATKSRYVPPKSVRKAPPPKASAPAPKSQPSKPRVDDFEP